MADAQTPRQSTAQYWDAVAPRYFELFRDEFDSKPFDREQIRNFARSLAPGAAVLDAGCGPCAHVAALLAAHGLRVTGVDLSAECIALSRRQCPQINFLQADLAQLPFADQSLHGAVAYYALHFQPKHSLPAVLRELARVLAPGSPLLMVAKEGTTEGWIDDPMQAGCQIYWADFQADELSDLLTQNGFRVTHCTTRNPYPDELPVRRISLTGVRL